MGKMEVNLTIEMIKKYKGILADTYGSLFDFGVNKKGSAIRFIPKDSPSGFKITYEIGFGMGFVDHYTFSMLNGTKPFNYYVGQQQKVTIVNRKGESKCTVINKEGSFIEDFDWMDIPYPANEECRSIIKRITDYDYKNDLLKPDELNQKVLDVLSSDIVDIGGRLTCDNSLRILYRDDEYVLFKSESAKNDVHTVAINIHTKEVEYIQNLSDDIPWHKSVESILSGLSMFGVNIR